MNSAGYIIAGYLYNKYPLLTPYQLVFVRSSFSIVYLALMINIKVKRIFYDEMERKYIGPLIFRSI